MAETRYDPEKRQLIVTPFSGDEMTVLLKLPSRRYMKKARRFVLPMTRMNCQQLLDAHRDRKLILPTDCREHVEKVAIKTVSSRKFPQWYAFKTQPLINQREALDKLYKENMGALFMRMGTGKSKVYIDFCTALFYEQEIDLAIVICPLTVVPVWTGETGQLVTHCPAPLAFEHIDSKFDWTEVKPKRDRMTWLTLGIESLSQGRAFDKLLPLLQNYKVALVVDESSRIKNHKAIRTQRVMDLGKHAIVKLIGTGTPATKSIIDLFAQMEFLDPNIVGAGDFFAFRNRYAIMGGYKKKEIVGYDNVEELTGLIEPYVYICDKPKGMPAQLWGERYTEMSPSQKEMYIKVKSAAIEGVKVANVLNRMVKLQQVTAGFLREDPKIITDPLSGREKRIEGEIIWRLPVEENPKLIELATLLEDLGDEQVIIWSRHLIEIDDIYQVLTKFGPTVKLTGAVPMEARGPLVEQFQRGKTRFIVSNQQIGGIGHTMTAAHLAWYLSNTNSLEDRLQSEDRIHRTGQTEGCYYLDFLMKRTVDMAFWDSIKTKKDLDIYVRDKIKEAGGRVPDELFGEI